MTLHCDYFTKNDCYSCPGLKDGLDAWRGSELARLKQLIPAKTWLPPVLNETAFEARTRAKIAVGGTLENPRFGRIDEKFQIIDLEDCELYHPRIQTAQSLLKAWVHDYKLMPYDIVKKTGELKYIILQVGKDDALMVRFVMRSKEAIDRMKKMISDERNIFHVLSVNLQPHPKAIVEGDEEIILSDAKSLKVVIGDCEFDYAPMGFIQTNLTIAGKLYQSAKEWLTHETGSILDLYCGFGAFAAHLARHDREVVGVEINADSIASAKASHPKLKFVAADAFEYLKSAKAFETFVVNPPRRGLGVDVCNKINHFAPEKLLYSSCSPESLAEDLKHLEYDLVQACAFEMFPLTNHWEVLTLLTRR